MLDDIGNKEKELKEKRKAELTGSMAGGKTDQLTAAAKAPGTKSLLNIVLLSLTIS